MQNLFYNNNNQTFYDGDLQSVPYVQRALTVHAAKKPDIMSHLHVFVRRQRVQDIMLKRVQLSRDISACEKNHIQSSWLLIKFSVDEIPNRKISR